MSKIAEAFRRLPPPVSYGLVSMVIVVAAVAIVLQLRPTKPAARTTAEQAIYRKCSQCGQVLEGTAKDLAAKGLVDPIERSTLTDAGRLCQKCNRNTLEFAFKCPKDGTVFVLLPRVAQSRVCPKCGWSPFAP